ncbi:MAG: hypothetical protein J5I93_22600 [Pirellulaceae bacterium]|nr:hypothetical protein [Pirellulaceae bacterium]
MIPRRSRLALRFRLSTLLGVTLLAALGLAAFKAYVEPFQVQKRAAQQLASAGGVVQYRTADMPLLVFLFGEQRFQHVVEVQLERSRIESKDLAALGDLPCLERLYLASTRVTDDGLRHVGKLKRLKRVSLWSTPITDQGIAHLAGLQQLEVLDVHHTRLTEASLESFRGHPQLVRLIHSFPIGDSGAAALASMPRLRVESLVCTGIGDQGLQQLASLKSLEVLRIDSSEVTDKGLAVLAQLKQLATVELRHCSASDAGIMKLAEAPALSNLDIHDMPINGDCLPALAERPRLSAVTLSNTRVRFGRIAECFGESATFLHVGPHRVYQSGPMTPCRVIWFSGVISADDVEHLASYPRLEQLTLDESPFDIRRASCLARLPALRSLELTGSCTDEGAEVIGRMTRLRELSLSGRNQISPAGYRQLARLKELRELILRSCGLLDRDLAFLRAMHQLEVLDLSGNRITSAGIDHLLDHSNLRSLNVSFCPEIDDQAFEKVSRLERLESLSAQVTQVTDVGLGYLFDMPHLRDVSVMGSGVTPRGLRALRGALVTQGGSIY